MNQTAYLSPQESMFQISSQSGLPFSLDIGEHRDIESQNYYFDNKDKDYLNEIINVVR